MDRLTAMRVFTEATTRGSVTAAADTLDMSRAMASRYLEYLEKSLGTRLLHRTTRRISLTDAGVETLEYCRQILALNSEMEALTGIRRTTPSGTLRITSSVAFAQARLTPLIADFLTRYPEVQIELIALERTVNLVEERIDLAIRIGNQLDETLVARQLGNCHSMICCTPAYADRHGIPHTPDELQQHRVVTHTTVGRSVYHLQHHGHTVQVPVSSIFQCNETTVTRQAVLESIGIALLPVYFIEDDLKNGRLIHLLPDYEPEPLGIHAVYLSRVHQPQLLRLMVDFLTEQFQK